MAVVLDLGSYNDIRDYATLQDRVRLWLDRGNELDALLPTFIANAENHINRVLRSPEMETYALMQAAGGVFNLPTDCLQIRSLKAAGRPLIAMSPGEMAEAYTLAGGSLLAGSASSYALTGRQVQVAPVADEAYGMTYWRRIPTLSITQPSNWLLDAHADVYLYGTLFHANTYIADTEASANWSALFEGALAEVEDVGRRARFGGPIVARSNVRQVRGVRA